MWCFYPLENTITINQSFEQSRNCSVKQERSIQNRKISENGTYKNEGSPIVETRIDSIIEKNNSTGTLETWELTTATYTGWLNSGTYYGCTNWTPAADTIEKDLPFEQTASDCKLNQIQNRQDREIETTTGEIRNKGTVVVETQTLMNQKTTQNSIGTKSNKVCLFEKDNSPLYTWYTIIDEKELNQPNFTITSYMSIPFLMVSVKTGGTTDYGGGSFPIPNLQKKSNTEFWYTAHDKVWKITRGDIKFILGNQINQHEICFE